jgi:hypothetical protein
MGLTKVEELEAWLNLFDGPSGIVLRAFLDEKADYHTEEMMRQIRAGEMDESRLSLARLDVIQKVLPDIRMRVQQLKGEINGNHE